MHTIIKIAVVSVLALFAIVGVVSISKAEENIDTEAVREKIMRGVLQTLTKASAANAKKINSKLKVKSQFDVNLLRTHIAQCWGLSSKHFIRVEVRAKLDINGTVNSVEATEPQRFKTDESYRIAARAAIRAIEDCSPLPLPAEHHELWKEFIFAFDPSMAK